MQGSSIHVQQAFQQFSLILLSTYTLSQNKMQHTSTREPRHRIQRPASLIILTPLLILNMEKTMAVKVIHIHCIHVGKLYARHKRSVQEPFPKNHFEMLV